MPRVFTSYLIFADTQWRRDGFCFAQGAICFAVVHQTFPVPSSWGRGFQIQPDYRTHVPFMASGELGLRMGNLIYRGLNRGESEHLNNHPLTLECSGLCCLSCQVQLILSSCQPLTSAALPRDTALWRVIRVTPLRVVGKSSASAPG